MVLEYAGARFYKGGGTKLIHGQHCWYTCKNRTKKSKNLVQSEQQINSCEGAVKFKLIKINNEVQVDPERYLIDYRSHSKL